MYYPMQAGRCSKLYLSQPLHYCFCFRLSPILIIIDRKELSFMSMSIIVENWPMTLLIIVKAII